MADKSIKRIKTSYYMVAFVVPLALFLIGKSTYNYFYSDVLWQRIAAFILALICGGFFAFFIQALQQIFTKKPAIHISKEGIHDDVSMARVGLIPWSDITKTEIKDNAGAPHLFIYVKDHTKYIDKKSWFKKGMLNQMAKDSGSPIAINLKLIEGSGKELQKTIQSRMRGRR